MTEATMTTYVPVIDISHHQGEVDFAVMRSRGVEGLILRATNGLTRDTLLPYYAVDARRHFGERQIGYYEFCNPKRGTPQACAEAFVRDVTSVDDLDRTFLMLDIESYTIEAPNAGTSFTAPVYAAWLREHLQALRALVDCPIIGYTNRSYWSWGVSDRQLAAELEWIVPRYPVSSPEGYVRYPTPLDPADWDDWAFARAPDGPLPPLGTLSWQGWQFSAGYNGAGSWFGCQSSNLDLNIVVRGAWERWTRTAPIASQQNAVAPTPAVQGDDDMAYLDHDGMVFAYDGFKIRRVRTGEGVTSTPIPKSRQAIYDIVAECDVAGPSPFDGSGDLAAYADSGLHALWQARPVAGATVVNVPPAIVDMSQVLARLDSLAWLGRG